MSIRINVRYLAFVTRPFIYTCSYDELIFKLSNKCKSFSETYSPALSDDFVKQFLDPNHLSLQRNLYRFDVSEKCSNDENLSKARKSEYTLFVLDKNEYFENKIKKYFPVLCKEFVSILDKMMNNIKPLSHKIGVEKGALEEIINSLKTAYSDCSKVDIDTFKVSVLNLMKRFRFLRDSLFNVDKKDEKFFFYQEINKELHKILDVVDGLISSTENTKMFALVSKAGTLQIAALKENNLNVMISSESNLSKNKSLISNVDHSSGVITSTINKLCKIFSVFDLNYFFGFEDKICIFDHPRKIVRNLNLVNAERSNNLYRKISPQKAIYIRSIVDESDYRNAKNAPQEFFDLLSLFVAYHHSYDEHHILKYYLNKIYSGSNYQKEDNLKFRDYLNKPTEHLYFDDSLAVLSACDETTNINAINKYLLKKKNVKNEALSHQLRIYSMWDFIYVCNSLTFGSMSLMINMLLVDYIKRKISDIHIKQFVHIKQARLGRIISRIDSNYNHSYLSVKSDSNNLCDYIFEEIGLVRLEKQVNETTDINWRSANLMSSQSYNRYALLLTFISLFITIVSYGLISVVAVGSTPDNYGGLVYNIFHKSPKIPVILTVIAIPIVIYLIVFVYETIRSLKFSKNVAKIDGFKTKKGKKISKNIQQN